MADYFRRVGMRTKDDLIAEIHKDMHIPKMTEKDHVGVSRSFVGRSGELERKEKHEVSRFSNIGKRVRRKSTELDKFVGSYYDPF